MYVVVVNRTQYTLNISKSQSARNGTICMIKLRIVKVCYTTCMKIEASSPKDYIDQLPPDRQAAVKKLRAVIRKNLPKGFKETMSYGMIGYVVPHSLYPDGYHCDTSLPLPFLSIASQKNFIGVYHMGIYADDTLLAWFEKSYRDRVEGKLDMGKSCIRFKKLDQIPYELIGELVSKVSVQDWITTYEANVKK